MACATAAAAPARGDGGHDGLEACAELVEAALALAGRVVAPEAQERVGDPPEDAPATGAPDDHESSPCSGTSDAADAAPSEAARAASSAVPADAAEPSCGAALLGLLLERGAPAALGALSVVDLSGTRLGGAGAVRPLLRRLSTTCSGLTELWIRGLAVCAESLAALGGGLPRLRLLALGGCAGCTDAALLAFLRALPRSTEHTIRRRPTRERSLQLFSPPSPARECELMTGAPLTHLEIRNCTALTDAAFDAITAHACGLQDLSAYGCRRLTDSGLAALSGLGCPNLRWINHSGAYKVSDAATQCLISAHPAILIYNNPFLFASH